MAGSAGSGGSRDVQLDRAVHQPGYGDVQGHGDSCGRNGCVRGSDGHREADLQDDQRRRDLDLHGGLPVTLAPDPLTAAPAAQQAAGAARTCAGRLAPGCLCTLAPRGKNFEFRCRCCPQSSPGARLMRSPCLVRSASPGRWRQDHEIPGQRIRATGHHPKPGPKCWPSWHGLLQGEAWRAGACPELPRSRRARRGSGPEAAGTDSFTAARPQSRIVRHPRAICALIESGHRVSTRKPL